MICNEGCFPGEIDMIGFDRTTPEATTFLWRERYTDAASGYSSCTENCRLLSPVLTIGFIEVKLIRQCR